MRIYPKGRKGISVGATGAGTGPSMEKRNIFGLFRVWLKKQGGQSQLAALIKSVDASGDGNLDMYEVQALLRKAVPDCSSLEAQMFITMVDVDGDGSLSMQELQDSLKGDYKTAGKSAELKTALKSAGAQQDSLKECREVDAMPPPPHLAPPPTGATKTDLKESYKTAERSAELKTAERVAELQDSLKECREVDAMAAGAGDVSRRMEMEAEMARVISGLRNRSQELDGMLNQAATERGGYATFQDLGGFFQKLFPDATKDLLRMMVAHVARIANVSAADLGLPPSEVKRCLGVASNGTGAGAGAVDEAGNPIPAALAAGWVPGRGPSTGFVYETVKPIPCPHSLYSLYQLQGAGAGAKDEAGNPIPAALAAGWVPGRGPSTGFVYETGNPIPCPHSLYSLYQLQGAGAGAKDEAGNPIPAALAAGWVPGRGPSTGFVYETGNPIPCPHSLYSLYQLQGAGAGAKDEAGNPIPAALAAGWVPGRGPSTGFVYETGNPIPCPHSLYSLYQLQGAGAGAVDEAGNPIPAALAAGWVPGRGRDIFKLLSFHVQHNRSQLDALFPEGQELNLNQNNRSQLYALSPEGQELNMNQLCAFCQ
eukprot:gene30501-35521_t